MGSMIEKVVSKCNSSVSNNKSKNDSLVNKPCVDTQKNNAMKYMLGATALATVVAVGILGRKGHLGESIQKLLGGKIKEPISKPATQNPIQTVVTNASDTASPVLSCEEKAKQFLSELYEKIIVKANKDGNTKRAVSFQQCKNDLSNLDTNMAYDNLLNTLYNELRCAEYPLSAIKNMNIDKITGADNSLILVKAQGGWHYRMPKCRQGCNSDDRISVNAVADENLIKSLDDLFGSGKVKGYYKTPDLAANWCDRHDPITIYLDENATPEILNKVKTACEKYIRSTDDVLLGDKFAPGFALQKSPSSSSIEALLNQAKSIDPNLEKVFRTSFTDIKTGKLKTSAGYIEVAQRILEYLQ